MKPEELSPANMHWGHGGEVMVQIQHPTQGGAVRLIVDKRLAEIRYEDESEDRVTIVIDQK